MLCAKHTINLMHNPDAGKLSPLLALKINDYQLESEIVLESGGWGVEAVVSCGTGERAAFLQLLLIAARSSD